MSLIHFAVARSRLPAMLALLAMLLLFIAPVISKSLMAQRGGMSAMMHDAAPAISAHHHSTMSAMTETSSATESHSWHHSVSLMDDSACGYCLLLIHLPLDSFKPPALWSLLQAAIPAAPLQLQPFIARWIPIWFRPRGPPVNALPLV
ncbi:DUF2946 domain-containing protein [Mixta intestinalis]|uniref:DUF2946 domain-containing protein n=1 Tax=Mixta intestinalis TaxID=1615494 RepID=A0A6P1Q483_9GAMM|nr:DUF2946 domain-containing protein [Mixta intestinalis]QHM73880.1 hypothetical protein C7M51_04238 [Mixta intestinalis]